jgi:hypothetical protein
MNGYDQGALGLMQSVRTGATFIVGIFLVSFTQRFKGNQYFRLFIT